MHASMGGQFKFAITDVTGKTVNVEYIMNEMYVTEVDAISNFVQTPGSNYGLGLPGKCPRYEKMMEDYKEYNGKMTEEMMMDTLRSDEPCAVARTGMLWRPRAASMRPVVPLWLSTSSPTRHTIEKPFSTLSGLSLPREISYAKHLSAASFAFSASFSDTAIHIVCTDEA